MLRSRAYLVISHAVILGTSIGAWEVAGRLSSRVQFLFGRPTLVASSLARGIWDGSIASDFLVTGLEAGLGFVLGMLTGTSLGLLLWYWPRVAKISAPYVAAFGAIPLFSLAPIMIVWFGTDISAKVALATLSTVGTALVQAYRGANSVSDDHLKLMKSFNASRWFVFKSLVIPTSLTWVYAAARMNVGFAILGAFIGEFLSANAGLGYRLLRAGGLYDIPSVLANVIMLVVLAYLMRLFVVFCERVSGLDEGVRRLEERPGQG